MYSLYSYTLNFKSLALSAFIALSTFGGVAAQAAPSTCWLGNNASGGSIPAQNCDVHVRRNANGHNVIDVMTPVDGQTMTVILWMDDYGNPSYAEVVFHGMGRTTMNYRWDNAGDLHLWKGDSEIYISIPA